MTLPTVKAIDGAVVQPTVHATQQAVESTAHFMQDTAASTGAALAGAGVRAPLRMAASRSSLLALAAEYVCALRVVAEAFPPLNDVPPC